MKLEKTNIAENKSARTSSHSKYTPELDSVVVGFHEIAHYFLYIIFPKK
jgi:hypothetical protein